ncbi:uncharacterized protein PSFLO_06570 [Pseudozyma flocculosa]|uniref:Trafficking protein particle complex subunit 11 domain-containing protein n=1 Tax=Pseudozyma flocculosa TaxID=84751 RepID=A0A5C3F9H1_9BASI|nr:uncharacterized protein PSFLO_06570 [Pseudozyma flocculosa]
MNAYPPELLCHHYPCMLVAGLLPIPAASTSTPSQVPSAGAQQPAASAPAQPPPPATQTTPPSDATTPPPTRPDDNGTEAATTASAAPIADPAAARTEDAADPRSSKDGGHPAHAYPDLCQSLAEIFNARGSNLVWDPARAQSTVFHSVLVQQNIRLPPAKTRLSPRTANPAAPPSPASNSGTASASASPETSAKSPGSSSKQLPPTNDAASSLASMAPRSPLSPLHPAGPLFPDGLIAPIWARKHREMIPAVFVSFFCLAEKPGGPRAEQTAETGAFLRRHDEELIRQIEQRKRSLTERGIKMTVVLLTSRGMLEDPLLEGRLSYVRRTSGLDSKASLFVLTPVSKQELNEFVTSLHRALHDSAVDFYREHARRVRRKRARYPPPPSVIQPILSAAAALAPKPVDLVPLSREGWIVRAEYKLATFAELQGDNDEALQRYQEAYDVLSGPCLGSTMMLPPRTKRWAEAKVLADTLSIKIAKLHLYRDDGAAAVRQLHRHLHRFTELSTGWGIGSMTFEYWSWLCKQYRMFADLMDAATRSPSSSPVPPFSLPTHAPPLPSKLLHPDVLSMLQAGMPAPHGMMTPTAEAAALGVSPAALIQGPGTFYYLAALCTLERRDRFHKLVAAEQLSEEDVNKHPSLSHEQKVDYTAQITEQLTRAYDCFKRTKMARLSLMVASKIALVYLEGGKHEMALRFLERILRSFRIEGCHAIQAWLTQLAAGCAVHIGDIESSICLLSDLLQMRLDIPERDRAAAEARLVAILEGDAALPEGKSPVRIESDGTKGLVVVEPVFLDESVEVGAPAAFQLRLTAPKGSRISSIAFASLEVRISGFEEPLVIHASDAASSGTEIVDVGPINGASLAAGDEEQFAKLRCGLSWAAGSTKVIQGSLVSDVTGTLELERVVLRTAGEAAAIEFVFDLSWPASAPTATRPGQIHDPRWLVRTKAGKHRYLSISQRESWHSARVRPRSYRLEPSASHLDTAYLDERFPIVLKLTNRESVPLRCAADLGLQAAYEGMDDTLQCGGDAPPSAQVRDHDCGTVAPGQTVEVPFWLRAARREGVRIVDVVVRSWPARSAADGGGGGDGHNDDDNEEEEETRGASETTLSIRIDVVPAFRVSFRPIWTADEPGGGEAKALLDLSDGDADNSDDDAFTDEDGQGGTIRRTPPRRRRRQRRVDVETTFEMRGPSPIEVRSIDVQLPSSRRGAITMAQDSAAESDAHTDVQLQDVLGRWERGDAFGVYHAFLVPSTRDGDDDDDSDEGFDKTACLGVAFDFSLVLTNTGDGGRTTGKNQNQNQDRKHEGRGVGSASVVVQIDSSPSFVFAGPRRLCIPHLLASSSRRVEAWRFVPLTLGRVSLPPISVLLRSASGRGARTGANGPAGDEDEDEERVVWQSLSLDAPSGLYVDVLPA